MPDEGRRQRAAAADISKLLTLCFAKIEPYPWQRRNKLSCRSRAAAEQQHLLCREALLKRARDMAAIEAEGFTIKAGMKNSKVEVAV